jgi:uncharacterized membrane protein (DUF485 family)
MIGKFLVWFWLFIALLLATHYIGLLQTCICVLVICIAMVNAGWIYGAINTYKARSEFNKGRECNELKM